MSCFCTNSIAQLPDLCPVSVEVGRNMSSDKLSVAARAAGFAMAYDEAPAGVGAKPSTGAVPPPPVQKQEPAAGSTEMVVRNIARSGAALGLSGWSFWKTA